MKIAGITLHSRNGLCDLSGFIDSPIHHSLFYGVGFARLSIYWEYNPI